jgi:CrcB protein
VVTSRRIEDAALPIDPDLDPPDDRRPDPRPDRGSGAPAAAAGPGQRVAAPLRRRPGGRRRRAGGGWRGFASRLRPGILAAIALGGALGGAARYGIERVLPTAPDAFGWTTFAINVSGSLVLAVLLVFVLEIWSPTRYVRPFAAIGFLGAYTTFSTWMVEADELVAHHRPGLAIGYVGGSLVAGLAAVSLGLVIGRAVLARRSRAGAPAGRS